MQNTRVGSGATRMMMSLMGGSDAIEEKSFADALNAKMNFAANHARANKLNSEAALNTDRLENMDTGREQFMQGATNLTQPQLDIMNAFMKSGQYQQQDDGPPTAQGDVSMMAIEKPEWVTPEVTNKYGRARMVSGANMMGTGKSNAEQIINALLSGANLSRQDQMIEGTLNPEVVAPAMAATAGKPTYNVTSSGIGYKPYGGAEDIDDTTFIDNANINAAAKINAAFMRNNINGGQLPAEAKMVEFYMDKDYPKEKAVEMARNRKNTPLHMIAAELYQEGVKNLALNREAVDWSQEQKEMFVQDQVIRTMLFLQNNKDKFSGSDDPLGIR